MSTPRRFVLPAMDREGVMMGLGLAQLAAIAAGGATTAMLASAGVTILAALMPLILAATIATQHWKGRPLLGWVRPVTHTIRTAQSWKTASPWRGSAGDTPPCLNGVTVTAAPLGQGTEGFAMVRAAMTASAVMEVSGGDFALLGDSEQGALLDAWGKVLAAHAKEGSPLERMAWTEVATRTSLSDHLEWVAEHQVGVNADQRRAYERLVATAAPETTFHRVYVTVTVSAARLRAAQWGPTTTNEAQRLTAALQRSIGVTRRALDSGGLSGELLTVTELTAVMREMIDPTVAMALSPKSGRLGDRLGVTGTDRVGPVQTHLDWAWFEADRCAHRSWSVSEWPRHAVRGDWLTDFLSHAGSARRMTVVFEPTAPSAAHKKIDRGFTKLEADSMVRDDHGKRITASLRRTFDQIEAREEELIDGFAEVNYVGLITASAPNAETFRANVEDVEAAALDAGMTLDPLDGQQDQAWAATLPLGLGVATQRFK